MQIGVLSDTHDHLLNIVQVLETCRDRGIETLFHCGDLTGIDMISHFRGFRVIYTMGNMDIAAGAIHQRFKKLREDNFAGPVFKGNINDVPIAATHSHLESELSKLVSQQQYRWIFHGHTHQRRDEVINGARIVNPGALGGLGKESRSFCIVDLDANDVEFIKV